ncbi:MAG: type II toxin-antitoxin system VapC family toxin, partial [Bacteroidetes bacterium]|nr:type II toxin-antitoxin system VapC family toxin [Bacteroidota bacterium]
MKYLLDTNIISALIDETNINYSKIAKRFSSLNDDDELYISILTLFEFEYSFFRCSNSNKQKSIRSTIKRFDSLFNQLQISKKDASSFGEIKSLIRDQTKTNTKNMKRLNFDIMIASSAISNSCVVVSGDK